MALQVKKRNSNTKREGAQLRFYRLAVVIDHGKHPNGKKNCEYIYPRKEDYHTYGFDWKWTLEKAKARLKEVQAQDKLERINNRKAKIQKRLAEQDLVGTAFLPESLCQEFEVFLSRKIGSDDGLIPERVQSHWRGAQKMISEVKVEPRDYEDNGRAFYNYIIKNRYSPSYMQKMLRIVNYWGYFVCRQRNQAFMPVPFPTGNMKEKIADAYFDQRPHGLESAPLSPSQLEGARSKFLPENFSWLYLTVWLGLRPSEADKMTTKYEGKNWRIAQDANGITILSVYQPKLVTLAREKRWKNIPILFAQQNEALRIIEEGNFRRPLTKTIHRYISERHNCYGGRKNFLDLMMSDGFNQRFENVSQWLGHTTLDRSLRNYKNKGITNYDLPKSDAKPQLKRVK